MQHPVCSSTSSRRKHMLCRENKRRPCITLGKACVCALLPFALCPLPFKEAGGFVSQGPGIARNQRNEEMAQETRRSLTEYIVYCILRRDHTEPWPRYTKIPQEEGGANWENCPIGPRHFRGYARLNIVERITGP
jgi:hypothetical protein